MTILSFRKDIFKPIRQCYTKFMRGFLRHFFTPHHTNNHRAKILHHHIISITIVFLLVLTFVLPSFQQQYPSVLGVSYNITTADLLILTNQKRAEAGLPPLSLSQELSQAAAAKGSNMFQLNYWAHIAPDGTTPWYFIRNAGYEYEYAGENLARGFTTSSEVVDAWMASPTHRQNILSPNYKEIGFAVSSGMLTGTDTVLVVQQFGSRYIAKSSPPVEVAVAQEIIPTATPGLSALQISVSPSPQQVSPAPFSVVQQPATVVAAAVNKPLIDTKTTTNNLARLILGGFIMVLMIDYAYIERKQIGRIVGHNLDHIIFLAVILLAIMIIGGGAIV